MGLALATALLARGCGPSRSPARTASGTGRAQREPGVAPYDPRVPEAVARRRVAAAFRMTPPFHARTARYLDGGTLGFTITDGVGRRLQGALASGSRPMPDSLIAATLARGDSVYLVPLTGFWLGADYPDKRGARPIGVGGAEERALLDLFDLVATQFVESALIDSLVDDCSGPAWLDKHMPDFGEKRQSVGLGLLSAGRRRLDPNGIPRVISASDKKYLALLHKSGTPGR